VHLWYVVGVVLLFFMYVQQILPNASSCDHPNDIPMNENSTETPSAPVVMTVIPVYLYVGRSIVTDDQQHRLAKLPVALLHSSFLQKRFALPLEQQDGVEYVEFCDISISGPQQCMISCGECPGLSPG